MTVFYSLATLLTFLVVVWLVRPLLRSVPPASVSSQRLNADIYRDQLEALERDLARGGISPADYESTRDELQLRLLDDTDEPASAPVSRRTEFLTAKRVALVIAVLIPLGGVGFYYALGAPQAIDPVSTQKQDEDKISSMVDGLAAKLKANPDNPKGWAMLARSYKVLGRMQEAEEAYLKAGKVIDTDPDLLADYADLLAVRAGGNLDGKPLELVKQALALNPQHPMSLMLAATGAYRQGNYAAAVNYWEKLRPMMDPESPDMAQLQADIEDARAKAGMKASSPSAAGPSKAPVTSQAESPKKPSTEEIAKMVEGLAARLKANPADLDGWARLGRSYKVMGRVDEAEAAYAKTGKLMETNPDAMADFADLLATRASGNLEGKPLALVNKALVLNPRHPMALMLSGSAALKRGDYAGAVQTWEKLLPVLEPGSRDAQWLTSSIADARAKGGLSALGTVKK